MEEVFENDSDPKPIKEKKVRKKRVVSEETKKRLREQLKKGRATALANRKRKLAEKKEKSKKISTPIITDTVKKESPVKDPEPVKETKVEPPPPSQKKEEVVNTPSPPKVKEPMIVKTPTPAPRIITKPINIPPPLPYQSTFKKMKRKW